MWIHTLKCTYVHAHTQNDRKDWNTRPTYKRAWHSGQSLEYVTWSSSLGRKANAHQPPYQILAKGRSGKVETSRRRMTLGEGEGSSFPTYLRNPGKNQ